MKTRHLLAAIAAALLALAAPALASNTGVTIQIPAATVVTSMDASDVTVLDAAGYFAGANVEAALAQLQRHPFVIVADTASLPLDEAGECDGFALALVSTETGGPLLYRCAVSPTWTPIFVPVGPVTSSQLTMATARLLGRTTASTGAIEQITVSSPLTLSGGALGVGTVGVANGGTGATSLTTYAPVCGGTTTTGAVQSCATGIGTSGYVLTSNGAAALPTWQAASGGGGAAGSDTQVTFNNAGTASGDAGLIYAYSSDTLSVGRYLNLGTTGQVNTLNIFYDPSYQIRGIFQHGGNGSGLLSLGGLQIAAQGNEYSSSGSGSIHFLTSNDASSYSLALTIDDDGGVRFAPRTTTPACAEGTSYYDASDHDFCDCVGASPAWRSRGGAGACTT